MALIKIYGSVVLKRVDEVPIQGQPRKMLMHVEYDDDEIKHLIGKTIGVYGRHWIYGGDQGFKESNILVTVKRDDGDDHQSFVGRSGLKECLAWLATMTDSEAPPAARGHIVGGSDMSDVQKRLKRLKRLTDHIDNNYYVFHDNGTRYTIEERKQKFFIELDGVIQVWVDDPTKENKARAQEIEQDLVNCLKEVAV